MNDICERRAQVLVVDDDPPVANSLRRLFKRAGFDVIVAGDGKEAISLLEQYDPDVVISDYRMPDVSGVEVLKQAQQTRPDAVRILISGYSEEGAFDRCRKQEAFFIFFSKPWDDKILIAEVQKRVTENHSGEPNA